jgi:hypothetical protein
VQQLRRDDGVQLIFFKAETVYAAGQLARRFAFPMGVLNENYR